MLILKTTNDYVITGHIEEEEYTSMRHHFINECEWTEEQYSEIEDCEWFSVAITLTITATQEQYSSFLGCCCVADALGHLKDGLGGYLPQLIEEVEDWYNEGI